MHKRRVRARYMAGLLAVFGVAAIAARLLTPAPRGGEPIVEAPAAGAPGAAETRAPALEPDGLAAEPALADAAASSKAAPAPEGVAAPAARPVGAGRMWEPAEPAEGEAWVAAAPPGGFTMSADGSLYLAGAPLTIGHPAVDAVVEVQERYTALLMSHPDVVGTAVGLSADGELAIVVTTREGAAEELPASLEGVPVVEWVTGEMSALAPGGKGKPGGGGGSTFDPTLKHRPAPIGVSVGHPDITAGTLGCRVTDGTAHFILSNNHVLANENAASVNDNVIQPGTFDGGADPADRIGALSDFEPIDFAGGTNRMDAAIASCSTADVLVSTPANVGYGTPRSANPDDYSDETGLPTEFSLTLNQTVTKYGRTTKLTAGPVSALNGTVSVSYAPNPTATFVGQIFIRKGKFSAGGDSGSLIVTQSGLRPVGLLFAGGGNTTIANPIGLVLQRFGVSIEGN